MTLSDLEYEGATVGCCQLSWLLIFYVYDSVSCGSVWFFLSVKVWLWPVDYMWSSLWTMYLSAWIHRTALWCRFVFHYNSDISYNFSTTPLETRLNSLQFVLCDSVIWFGAKTGWAMKTEKLPWNVGREWGSHRGLVGGVRGRESGDAKTCFSAGIHGIRYRFII